MSEWLVVASQAGRRVSTLERQLSEAVRQRDAAVRSAVAAGEMMTVVARAAGISRQRVKQIMVAA